MNVHRSVWTLILIFVACFAIYRVSPRGQLYDSRYTLAVASQLAAHGRPDLDTLSAALVGQQATPAVAAASDYRLVLSGGRLHYLYPPGTPLLAVPFTVGFGWLGVRVVDAEGLYQRGVERRLQRILAALSMATLACLFFWTARTTLDERTSLALTLAAALASPIWSTASRSLWSHTTAALLQGVVVLLLLRSGRAARPAPVILLASLLAWSFFCRPTAAIPALAVTLFIAREQRERLPALLATGGAWALGFVAWSQLTYSTLLPPYYQPGLHSIELMPEALLGNLISPARGLLVYSPWIVALAALLWRRRRRLRFPSLALLGASIVVAHWLLVSSHAPWWAGWGYGPRLMTDVIPWIVLLAVLALASAPPPPRALRVAALALVAIGVVLHGIGAFSRGAVEWNEGQHERTFEARLWDWKDPPFLR